MNFLGIDSDMCQSIGSLFGQSIAYAYGLMVKLAEGNLFENVGLEKVTASIYTLLGVFMVFRVLISMLNYLIDPDRINDKQVGAGKMLGRIVISIALLLTLNSYIFPLLGKAQSVILESNILSKIFSVGDETEGYSSNTNAINTSKINFLWQDVKAEESINSFTCNYVYIKLKTGTSEVDTEALKNGSSCVQFNAENDAYFKPIVVSAEFIKNDGTNNDYDYHVGGSWYMHFKSSVQEYKTIVPKNNNFNSANGNSNVSFSSMYATTNGSVLPFAKPDSVLDNGKCPLSISGITCDGNSQQNGKCNISDYVVFHFSPSAGSSMSSLQSFGSITRYDGFSDDVPFNNNDVYKAILGYRDSLEQKVDASSSCKDVSNNTEYVELGLAFSKGVVRSFITKSENCDGECEERYEAYLNDSSANKALATDVKRDRIDFSYLLAIIVGIALFIILMVLCIEVIVRNFKLWLLQVISPIPVVSYINPNDKIFNQWVKMYGSAYADLFIKLIALHLTQILITIVLNNKPEGLIALLYFGGIFTFAKTAPNLISKLFGIDGAGTFKDSFGVMKAGLTGAVGGVAAAGAAAWTGVGAFHATKGQGGWNRAAAALSSFGSGLGGVARGIGAGTKGNMIAGARSIATTNANNRGKYEAGYAAGAVMLAGMTHGVYDPNKKDERVEAAYDDIISKQKNMDSRVEDEILKKDHYGMKQKRDELAYMKQNMTDLSGNAITTAQLAAKEKEYNDALAANKARYLSDVKSGKIDDSQTLANMKTYDRTVEHYSKTLGNYTSSKDADYSYNFNNLSTTDDVIKNYDAAVKSNDIGKQASAYKSTKSKAEDAKITFTSSTTRAKHIKISNEK